MLSRLYIKNYATIDSLKLTLESGLTIITGETGAGKSVLLGALALAIGSRIEQSAIRDREEKCVVEATFHLHDQLKQMFLDSDLDFDNESTFRREIAISGKSRAFINDTPVSIKTLRTIGTHIIDIHSQHQTLEINNSQYRLEAIDSFGDLTEPRDRFKEHYSNYKADLKKLSELNESKKKIENELEFNKFQFNQLDEAQLEEVDQEQLETELKQLSNAEEIKSNLYGASELIDGGESSVISNLRAVESRVDSIKNLIEDGASILSRVSSCRIELQDIAEDALRTADIVEYNPNKAEIIEDKLNTLYSLQKRYSISETSELIEIRDQLRATIESSENIDDEILALENKISKAEIELRKKASILSGKRRSIAEKIEEQINIYLKQLTMPHSIFKIVVNEIDDISEFGFNTVDFMFTALKGGTLFDISAVASGGETSRIVLALKSTLSEKIKLPSIIFDEIDTGVSGDVANGVGNILKSLSTKLQVIAITHLPQIASKADNHLFVYKDDNDKITKSNIKTLSMDERITEIAKMLSGSTITESAISNAKELLEC